MAGTVILVSKKYDLNTNYLRGQSYDNCSSNMSFGDPTYKLEYNQ